jgi:hypothetical protein
MAVVGIGMVMAFVDAEDGCGTWGATGGERRRFCANEGGIGFAVSATPWSASFCSNWNWSFSKEQKMVQ